MPFYRLGSANYIILKAIEWQILDAGFEAEKVAVEGIAGLLRGDLLW